MTETSQDEIPAHVHDYDEEGDCRRCGRDLFAADDPTAAVTLRRAADALFSGLDSRLDTQAGLAAILSSPAAAAPPVTAVTPGQGAYEAHRASFWKRHGWDGIRLLPDGQWEQMLGGGQGAQGDWEAAAQAVEAPLREQLAAATAERDKAYGERAHLVAYLAACYPSEIVPAESDSGAWFLVFVTTPAGQMSWHLHEDDLDLFEPLLNAPETGIEWDGHTTEEKYERLAELTRRFAVGGGVAGLVAAAVQPARKDAAIAETVRALDVARDEISSVRNVLARVLGEFQRSGSGHSARLGQVAIARAYRDGGLPLPEDLAGLGG